MTALDLSDEIYPTMTIATILEALAAEGVSPDDALAGVELSKSQAFSIQTRVSLINVIAFMRNASRLSQNPRFAYNAGLKFRVSSFGIFGFAILSSTTFRQAVKFALDYQQLATPLAKISFREQNGYGIWTVSPLPHPGAEARLCKSLVELQFGIFMSLHRDVLGPTFVPHELHVTYSKANDLPNYEELFGCRVRFNQPENRFIFHAARLDGTPTFGNELTHAMLVNLCDGMLKEMRLNTGLVGKVRKLLLTSAMKPMSIERVARELGMSVRTLRRKLADENASFRKVGNELRRNMAIKHMHDANLTIKEIAHALGFSDPTSFRRAFRQWTKSVPSKFRGPFGHGRQAIPNSAEWPDLSQLWPK